jgi:hypothetical protein
MPKEARTLSQIRLRLLVNPQKRRLPHVSPSREAIIAAADEKERL